MSAGVTVEEQGGGERGKNVSTPRGSAGWAVSKNKIRLFSK